MDIGQTTELEAITHRNALTYKSDKPNKLHNLDVTNHRRDKALEATTPRNDQPQRWILDNPN